jgi:hypothetical protein
MDNERPKVPNQGEWEISILLFPDDGVWIAQCMEYDLNAQGETHEAALESLGRTMAAQAILDWDAGRTPFEDMPSAPAKYVKLYNAAMHLRDVPMIPPPEFTAHHGVAGQASRAVPPAWMIRPWKPSDIRIGG